MTSFFRVLTLLFLVLLRLNEAYASRCIIAEDFGLGGTFYIPANPDESNPGSTNLLQTTPSNQQIAPWVSTNLSTPGISSNPTSKTPSHGTLKVYINGAWAPWGGDVNTLPGCVLRACNPNEALESICFNDGKTITYENPDSIPCKLGISEPPATSDDPTTLGWGLYGLIAVADPSSGLSADPNSSFYFQSLPPSLFRTFRMSPLQSGDDGYYFTIDSTQLCQVVSGKTTCITDTNSSAQKYIPQGKLYFKILDSYYKDNTGSYVLDIVSGVYAPKGFIEQTVDIIDTQLLLVSHNLYVYLTQDSGFIYAIKAMLVLYMALTGLSFMMGMLKIHQGELLTRLFKASLVMILISEDSWNFFNTYLFSFFTEGAKSIADIIVNATVTINNDGNSPKFVLPEGATALSVFDVILKMLVAPPVHLKIISLLFFKWFCVYIPLFYVCIFYILVAIVRSVMLYIVAIILISIMLVIAPIFLSFLLFKFTGELFSAWLKQLLACAMQLIVVSATLALLISFISNQLEALLKYKVCFQIIWSFPPASLQDVLGNWFDIWFWTPTIEQDVTKAVTPINFFSFLIICILFNAFMEEIPTMIDVLSGAVLQPISHFYGGAMKTLQGSAPYRAVNFAGDLVRGNTVGRLTNQIGTALTTSKDSSGKTKPNLLGKATALGKGIAQGTKAAASKILDSNDH